MLYHIQTLKQILRLYVILSVIIGTLRDDYAFSIEINRYNSNKSVNNSYYCKY